MLMYYNILLHVVELSSLSLRILRLGSLASYILDAMVTGYWQSSIHFVYVGFYRSITFASFNLRCAMCSLLHISLFNKAPRKK